MYYMFVNVDFTRATYIELITITMVTTQCHVYTKISAAAAGSCLSAYNLLRFSTKNMCLIIQGLNRQLCV